MNIQNIRDVLTFRMHPLVNRKFKDHLFRFLFREKKDLLSLYNAVNGTDYSDPDELTIMTLEDVIYLGMKNDIGFLIDCRIGLYEHQSTWCPNMPLRGLLYFSRMLQVYVEQEGLDLYAPTKLSLPLPQYLVFYNGTEERPDRTELLLSDLFTDHCKKGPGLGCGQEKPALECRAIVLNINAGHNPEIMSRCRMLSDYARFIQTVRDFLGKGFRRNLAVNLAVDYCIEHDILADILRKNRAEVTDMLLTFYDEKLHNKTLREEGRIEGRTEGRKQARDQLNELNRLLAKDGRIDDLLRAAEDPAFQDSLLREYGL